MLDLTQFTDAILVALNVVGTKVVSWKEVVRFANGQLA